MVEPEPELIPTLEAAQRLGVDVLDVYRMIDDGRLIPAWDGHRLVVRVAQVDALTKSAR
jgi:excisionase family DNA binding protein